MNSQNNATNIGEIATTGYVDSKIEQIYKEVRAMLEEQYMFPSGYCTRKQALHLLGKNRSTLWVYCQQGLIGYTGSGQSARFSIADIKKFLQSTHVKADTLERRLKEASTL